MSTLSPAQIFTLARNAGLSPSAAAIATAIALAESGGRTDAVGDVGLQDAKWGPSIGLWQIRSLRAEYGTGSPRDASRLKDPTFNAAAMVSISGKGGNWKPWSTYTSGSYKRYVSEVAAGMGQSGVAGDGATTRLGDNVSDALDKLNPFSGWAADALKIGLYVLGGGAAVALVVVGAVHTVSDK